MRRSHRIRSGAVASKVMSPGSTMKSGFSSGATGDRAFERPAALRTSGILRCDSLSTKEENSEFPSGAMTSNLATRDLFRPMSGFDFVRSSTQSCHRRIWALTRSRFTPARGGVGCFAGGALAPGCGVGLSVLMCGAARDYVHLMQGLARRASVHKGQYLMP